MIDIGCCGHTDSYLAISQMGYDYVELSAQQIMELTDEEFSEFLKLYKKTGFPCLGFNEYCTAEFPLVGPGSNSDACREYAQKVCERGHALGHPLHRDWSSSGSYFAGRVWKRAGRRGYHSISAVHLSHCGKIRHYDPFGGRAQIFVPII